MKFISLMIMAVSLLALLATCVWLAKRNSLTFLANVAEGTHHGAITKLTDAAITVRHLLFKKGTDDGHVAVSGASDLPWGTIDDEAAAAEESVAVQLLGKGSAKRMVASGVINAGVAVYAAASGKVAASGTVVVGISLSAAGADNDIIEVVDVAPVTISNPGVAASLYDANSILAATADNTPVALTVGASTVVGRKASGNIVALTAAELALIRRNLRLVRVSHGKKSPMEDRNLQSRNVVKSRIWPKIPALAALLKLAYKVIASPRQSGLKDPKSSNVCEFSSNLVRPYICQATKNPDGEGFEPSLPFGKHAFQACAIDHSATHPFFWRTGIRN